MLASILFGIALALHLVLAVVLIRKYLQTRDIGFVWLGMAVVIWPVISAVLEQGERTLMSHAFMHQSVGVYPFNLLERGEMTAGTVVIALSSLHQLIESCSFVGCSVLPRQERNLLVRRRSHDEKTPSNRHCGLCHFL